MMGGARDDADAADQDWRLPAGTQTVSIWLRCRCRDQPTARPVHFTVAAVRLMRTLFKAADIVGSFWCRKCKEPTAIRMRDLHVPHEPPALPGAGCDTLGS